MRDMDRFAYNDAIPPKNGRALPLKEEIYLAMNEPYKAGLFGRVFSYLIIFLILANIVLIFADSVVGDNSTSSLLFNLFDIFSAVCFCLEYICRVWSADSSLRSESSSRPRLHYILSPMGIIDFLSFFPTFVGFFVVLPVIALNTISILRLLRVIKLTRYMMGIKTIQAVFSRRGHQILAAFMVLLMLLLIFAVLLYAVENEVQPEKFSSVAAGMYWAITTATSTGYGDIVPITQVGRLLSFILMLLSIGVVALPAGILSAGFMEESESTVKDLEHDEHQSAEITLVNRKLDIITKELEAAQRRADANARALAYLSQATTSPTAEHPPCPLPNHNFKDSSIRFCPYCGEEITHEK